MDEIVKLAKVSQRAILSHLLNREGLTETYKECLFPKLFGEYSKIYSYIAENGSDKTTDLHWYLIRNKLTQEYTDILWEDWYANNLDREIEKLLKIYYFDSRNSSTILSTIDEYSDRMEKLERIRNHNNSLKYNGLDIGTTTYEEICEKNANYDEKTQNFAGIPFGIPSLDRHTDWFRAWTVTRINGYSNVWKSKFTYMLGNKFLKEWHKVTYISLEVPKKTLMLNLFANWSKIDVKGLERGKEVPDLSGFPFDKLEIVDDLHEWSEIEKYIEATRPDVAIIDYCQNIQVKWMPDLFNKMEFLAPQMQLLALKTGTRILDVSQVANADTRYKVWDKIPSKGSGALVSAADIALVLVDNWRSNNFISLIIAKNKFGVKDVEIALVPNFAISHYEDRWEMWSNMSWVF